MKGCGRDVSRRGSGRVQVLGLKEQLRCFFRQGYVFFRVRQLFLDLFRTVRKKNGGKGKAVFLFREKKNFLSEKIRFPFFPYFDLEARNWQSDTRFEFSITSYV